MISYWFIFASMSSWSYLFVCSVSSIIWLIGSEYHLGCHFFFTSYSMQWYIWDKLLEGYQSSGHYWSLCISWKGINSKSLYFSLFLCCVSIVYLLATLCRKVLCALTLLSAKGILLHGRCVALTKLHLYVLFLKLLRRKAQMLPYNLQATNFTSNF